MRKINNKSKSITITNVWQLSIFCVATIIIQNCFYSPGHGVYQSFTGSHWNALPLLHDDVAELADIWDFAHFHLPLEDPPNMLYWVQVRRHTWPALPSASSVKQWSSWRCVWNHCHAGTLLCNPVSGGRRSCSAAVFHSTCMSSCFPQWNITLQHLQHSCSLRPWHSHHHAWL